METTLFDRYGVPKVYITDEEENFIYLWKGKAVAYIDDENVYGWKGKHLGWFIDGILYDLKGMRVGFIIDKCPVTSHTEPTKYTKLTTHTKSTHNSPFSRVSLTEVNSDKDLEELLSADVVSIL